MCHFVEIVALVTGVSLNAVMLRLPHEAATGGSVEAGRLTVRPYKTGAGRIRRFGVSSTEK
jgi:hypothetical protein